MKLQIKEINKEKGIMQITTTDERWYTKELPDKTKLFVPSVTWIAGFYPKGIQFYKWLAEKGWDEAEAIKSAAGDKGSKVHKAAELILAGGKVNIDDKFPNPSTGLDEELTPQEYECLMSLVDWLDTTKPEIISTEYNVFDEIEGYAGTVDMKCKINGELYIVDLKTGQSIWPEYELQLSAYRHAEPEVVKTAILQIGYNRNKNQKYKFTEIENKYDLFLAAKRIWKEEASHQIPAQKDYPLILSWTKPLEIKLEAPLETVVKKPRKVVRKIKVIKKKK
jgi:hypothetical protein